MRSIKQLVEASDKALGQARDQAEAMLENPATTLHELQEAELLLSRFPQFFTTLEKIREAVWRHPETKQKLQQAKNEK